MYHIAEDLNLQWHYHENLKSCMEYIVQFHKEFTLAAFTLISKLLLPASGSSLVI